MQHPFQLKRLLIALALTLLLAPAAEAASTVLKAQHLPSRLLGRAIDYNVYLPDGYDSDAGRRYPVLYLLPGTDSVPDDWLHLAHLQALADRMIAAGRVAPLLIVMPDAGNSWYVDNPDPGGDGPVATAYLTELIPGIEARYRALGRRDGRAIAGLSMGGFGAIHLGFLRPDLFAAIASMSGALYLENQPLTRENIEDLHGAFGRPFSRERFEAGEPLHPHPGPGQGGAAAGDLPRERQCRLLRLRRQHAALLCGAARLRHPGDDAHSARAATTGPSGRPSCRACCASSAGPSPARPNTRDPLIDTVADDACPP